MKAEIIAIGTELTTGASLDTNSQWLSVKLAERGVTVGFHTTVADNLDDMVSALKVAVERADLVLLSGGLGPTLDDLTRQALAELMGVELELHAASLEHVASFFRRRGREMAERNRIQAMFPQGSEPLENPIGTAPGIWLRVPRANREPASIAAMPGVPSELQRMYLEQVVPRLPPATQIIVRAKINCFGLGESHTEELLGELTARGRDPEIGITASEATIALRIVAQGSSPEDCQRKIDQASAEIRERLGTYIFGSEEEELEDVVVEMLRSRRQTLATIEAGTAGELARRLFRVPGARDAIRSSQIVAQMPSDLVSYAQEQLRALGVDFVLVAGPEELRDEGVSVIPTALAGPETSVFDECPWSGNPAIFLSRTSKAALDLLRRSMLNHTTQD